MKAKHAEEIIVEVGKLKNSQKSDKILLTVRMIDHIY